jgi:hypothetical protein
LSLENEEAQLTTCGNFAQFIDEELNCSDLLNKDQINFSEIKFTHAHISEIYDVKEAR